MRRAIVLGFALLAACEQTFVVGVNRFSDPPVADGGGGSVPSDPAEAAAESCAAEEVCRPDYAACEAERSCQLRAVRVELWGALLECLAACHVLADCLADLTADAPSGFAAFASACDEASLTCPELSSVCAYDFLPEAAYSEMTPCFSLACDATAGCLVPALYPNHPACAALP